MRYELRMLESHRRHLEALLGDRSAEQACFLLCYLVHGDQRTHLLVREVVPLSPEDLDTQRGDQLSVAPRAMLRVARIAQDRGCSVCMVHTHPMSEDTTHFSIADDIGNRDTFRFLYRMVPRGLHSALVWNGPLTRFDGRVHHDADSWSDLSRIVIADAPSFTCIERESRQFVLNIEALDRQVRLLGNEAPKRFSGARVLIAGGGGMGGLISQFLGHASVAELIVVEPGRVKGTSATRLPGATSKDVADEVAKAHVIRRYVRSTTSSSHVEPIVEYVEAAGILSILVSSDLLVCATDSTLSRAYLNQVAHQYLIPLVDTGLQFKVDESGRPTHEIGKVNFMMPGHACLSCIGHLPAELLRRETLSAEEFEAQKREGYIIGGTEPEPSMMAFNALIAGRAAQRICLWLAGFSIERSSYEQFAPLGLNGRDLVRRIRKVPRDDCLFCPADAHFLALGDSGGMLIQRSLSAIQKDPILNVSR